MNKKQLESFLGRPLTSYEDANRESYLDIAKESLEDLLCASTEMDSETRTFESREGYSTLFVGFFTDIEKVEIDGEIIEPSEYYPAQWDKRSAKWYNSIVFKYKQTGCDVDVTADWGFEGCYPKDLLLLTARLFDLISKENKFDREVNSKSTEDFSISFNHSSTAMQDTLAESFAKDNAKTLNKYSMCNVGAIRHGRDSIRC